MTVEAFLTEHVRETKLSLKATSWRKPEVVFRLHVIPCIGRLPLASVTERTLAELYASLKPTLGNWCEARLAGGEMVAGVGL
jgi:hypothetical protein